MRLTALRKIDRSKYDIKICCLVRKGRLGEEAEKMGYVVDILQVSDALYNIFTTFKLFRYIKRNRFAIVQSSLFHANFHARIAARLAAVPIIITEEHGEHYIFKRLKFVPFVLVDRTLSLITDRIICCVGQMKESLVRIEHIRAEKVEVITNAVDEDNFSNIRPKSEVRAELGVGDDFRLIGTIGTLRIDKAQHVLLRAFSEIIKTFPDLNLLVVGDGPLRENLQNTARDLGIAKRVIFTGHRLDVADLLNVMDIFVLSSKKEGLPLPLLEAMYMGIPCVVPRIGGIPDVVENGQTGYLFEFPDHQELSNRVLQLLQDRQLALKMGQAGREKAQKDLTSGRYAGQLMQLYERLLIKKGLN